MSSNQVFSSRLLVMPSIEASRYQSIYTSSRKTPQRPALLHSHRAKDASRHRPVHASLPKNIVDVHIAPQFRSVRCLATSPIDVNSFDLRRVKYISPLYLHLLVPFLFAFETQAADILRFHAAHFRLVKRSAVRIQCVHLLASGEPVSYTHLTLPTKRIV